MNGWEQGEQTWKPQPLSQEKRSAWLALPAVEREAIIESWFVEVPDAEAD